MSISKAQSKRNKVEITLMSNTLKRMLIGFQNEYLGAYTGWQIAKIENRLAFLNKRIEEKDFTPSQTEEGINFAIKQVESRLAIRHILTLNYITEAKEAFDIKFDKLVTKCLAFGLNTRDMKVETINSNGTELEFLIMDNDIEVHARVIFVNGEIKAPHYRFITTKRNK